MSLCYIIIIIILISEKGAGKGFLRVCKVCGLDWLLDNLNSRTAIFSKLYANVHINVYLVSSTHNK